MGFHRQEHCRGLPFPSPWDLPDQGIEPTAPALESRFFTTEPPWEGLSPLSCQSLYEARKQLGIIKHFSVPGGASSKERTCQCRRYEMRVQSLGWVDSLEKGRTTHSDVLAWKIPWTEEPGQLQSMGSQRLGHDWNDLAFSPLPLLLFSIFKLSENLIIGPQTPPFKLPVKAWTSLRTRIKLWNAFGKSLCRDFDS